MNKMDNFGWFSSRARNKGVMSLTMFDVRCFRPSCCACAPPHTGFLCIIKWWYPPPSFLVFSVWQCFLYLCAQNTQEMIPLLDSMRSVDPGRSTLHLLFILGHLRAAQKLQGGSSRLYTVFVDFKQAYDLIPRDKLWDHLNYCQIPQHLVSILYGLYHADEHTMLDGDRRRRANV